MDSAASFISRDLRGPLQVGEREARMAVLSTVGRAGAYSSNISVPCVCSVDALSLWASSAACICDRPGSLLFDCKHTTCQVKEWDDDKKISTLGTESHLDRSMIKLDADLLKWTPVEMNLNCRSARARMLMLTQP